MRAFLFLVCLVSELLLSCVPTFAKEPVDKILVLMLDSSASLDDADWALQIDGLYQAFRDPSVVDALTGFGTESTAVITIEWSGSTEQRRITEWSVIRSAEDALRYADIIRMSPRIFGLTGVSDQGMTAIGSAIWYGVDAIRTSPYEAPHVVIDVSSDGNENSHNKVLLTDARAYALTNDVVINGLTILANGVSDDKEKNLVVFFEKYVIAGPGSFVEPAAHFGDFARAIKRKIAREIAVALK